MTERGDARRRDYENYSTESSKEGLHCFRLAEFFLIVLLSFAVDVFFEHGFNGFDGFVPI